MCVRLLVELLNFIVSMFLWISLDMFVLIRCMFRMWLVLVCVSIFMKLVGLIMVMVWLLVVNGKLLVLYGMFLFLSCCLVLLI